MGLFMSTAVGSVAVSGTSARVLWVLPGQFRGQPAWYRGRVFARTAGGQIVSADANSGLVHWRTPLTTTPGFVSGGRLVVSDDVVVGGDDRVEGISWNDGARIWTARTQSGAGAGVQLGDVSGGLVFTGSYVSRLYAFDLRTGQTRWSAELVAGGDSLVFGPRVDAEGVVATFASFRDRAGGVAAFDVSGRRVWRTDVASGGGIVGPACLAGELVLVADRAGVIHALDRSSGEVRWSLTDRRARAPAEDFRPLAASGQTVVVGSLTGEVVAYDLATHVERWRAWPVEASIAFGLSLRDHIVWIPYVSGLIVGLELTTGRLRWRFGDSGEGFRWVPLVHGPDIFLSGATGGLVALRMGGTT